ncbi:MAG: hypothetical protein V7739_09825 [Motiliproteus sp.]
MKIYVQIDDNDGLDTSAATAINSAIVSWLETSGSKAVQIGASDAKPETESQDHELQSPPGIYMTVKRRAELKDPFNFLYPLAKQHKAEFVVGIIDEKSGDKEDVCYFGFEEGKPDIYEIANYLEL